MRSKSLGEMSGEYGGCSSSSHPQRWSSCRTNSFFVILRCRAGLLHCPQDPDVYPELNVVPVTPGSPYSKVCSAIRNKVASNDTLTSYATMTIYLTVEGF
ncbi:hypothetical protein TNCT_1481 [Trichonephila clavata]|uniref:Uncharacterized protein n=1 Tax=Trichonephila clavata TaxID=2740835 RepID=A0A8X6GCJ4_TRICU|nr:hypothetical protein TNCT_1481 [Trichonephila clavata]